MHRRKFIKGIMCLSGLGFISGIYAWQIEPFLVEFVRKKMLVKNLPENLIGKTLVQISDIHIGSRFDYSYIIEAFKDAQKLDPDFVVYTGDYINHGNQKQIVKLEEVMRHIVKGKMGTIGVLGNHDYGKNWEERIVSDKVTDSLEKSGMTVLRNEAINLNGLNFIGIDDFWGINFDPDKAMKDIDIDKANLVLCHNPDVCDLDIWQGYKGWILAGHTHGGQCKPPFLDPPILPVKNKRYSSGEIPLEDGRTLYINRALGHVWQVRFNVRPEVTVFELQKV